MVTYDILDHIGDAIYGLDPEWKFTFFNQKAEEFFARNRGEVIGRSFWDCFPKAKEAEISDSLRRVMRSREPVHLDYFRLTTGQWADVHIFPLDDGGLGLSWRDLSERKKQEIALEEAVENQDMLFRELAHRVTNNFQELATRLDLQGRTVEDPGARDICEKMATSIRCMALVHRRLYSSQAHIDAQDIGEYVRTLCEDLSSSLPKNLSLTAVVQLGTPVSVDVATTVGMMIAELVMNSRKYAWAPGQPGRMVVTMRRDADDIEIELCDDGRGVPEGVDLRNSSGLGLKLLNLQIKRLKGSFAHRNVERGADFLLRFPVPGREPKVGVGG
jgi:PAS domain S-box-containing protein